MSGRASRAPGAPKAHVGDAVIRAMASYREFTIWDEGRFTQMVHDVCDAYHDFEVAELAVHGLTMQDLREAFRNRAGPEKTEAVIQAALGSIRNGKALPGEIEAAMRAVLK